MSLYAIIDNNIVTEVKELSEADYQREASYHGLIVEITDMIPQPEVGWILQGNQLVMANASMTDDERDLFQQRAQRLFGLHILPTLIDQMGARNLKLARQGTPVDVATLASQMASIKLLTETGALKTVRTICTALKPAFPNHADILDNAINEINNFLANNDFE